MSDIAPLRWGIVGPGGIAHDFAGSLARHDAGRVVAVHGRSAERAAAFAADHGPDAAITTDLEDLLAVPGLEAVYVATPHAAHKASAERLLQEGVPVLCEKPMTTSARDTEWLIGLAGMTRTPLLEAWMYRTHPQWARLLEMIRGGELGRVTRIAARFGYAAAEDPASRLFDPALGGGAILDVGGYPASAALAIAGAALDTEPADLETTISGGGSTASSGVDVDAIAVVKFGDGLTATLATAITRDLGTGVTVSGEAGTVTLDTPFIPGNRRDCTRATLRFTPANGGGSEREEILDAELDCYAAEAMAMAGLVRGGLDATPPAPMVDHAESIAIASLLDAWLALVPASADSAAPPPADEPAP